MTFGDCGSVQPNRRGRFDFFQICDPLASELVTAVVDLDIVELWGGGGRGKMKSRVCFLNQHKHYYQLESVYSSIPRYIAN